MLFFFFFFNDGELQQLVVVKLKNLLKVETKLLDTVLTEEFLILQYLFLCLGNAITIVREKTIAIFSFILTTTTDFLNAFTLDYVFFRRGTWDEPNQCYMQVIYSSPFRKEKKRVRDCLVGHFKQLLEHFKHTKTYFHILFHSHVYQKHTNNVTQTPLPNTP